MRVAAGGSWKHGLRIHSNSGLRAESCRSAKLSRNVGEFWTESANGRAGPLNTADGLIAATALEHSLTLATRNIKDYEGLDLPLIDPWKIERVL